MSLAPGTMVHQGNVVGGVMPDISSALGYKEHIGSACINPNGYTAGSFFIGADDGYFYKVTQAIAAGDTITVGTNCVQTDVGTEIKSINSDLTEQTLFSTLTTTGSTITEITLQSSYSGYRTLRFFCYDDRSPYKSAFTFDINVEQLLGLDGTTNERILYQVGTDNASVMIYKSSSTSKLSIQLTNPSGWTRYLYKITGIKC